MFLDPLQGRLGHKLSGLSRELISLDWQVQLLHGPPKDVWLLFCIVRKTIMYGPL